MTAGFDDVVLAVVIVGPPFGVGRVVCGSWSWSMFRMTMLFGGLSNGMALAYLMFFGPNEACGGLDD